MPRLSEIRFSILTVTPPDWHLHVRNRTGQNAFLLARTNLPLDSHVFRDLQTGTILIINSDSTFSVNDPEGYTSGKVRAQQMQFEGHHINIWHQDWRFSFTCSANLKTSFCFGWLVDRRFCKSCRILDPGRTD